MDSSDQFWDTTGELRGYYTGASRMSPLLVVASSVPLPPPRRPAMLGPLWVTSVSGSSLVMSPDRVMVVTRQLDVAGSRTSMFPPSVRASIGLAPKNGSRWNVRI